MSMEKKRIRPVKSGRSLRMSYSRQKEVLDMPNLIEVQRNSYEWFLSDGLKEALDDISPIEDYSQIGTPTYTFDLAKLLVSMIVTDKYGYYHATNEGGYISWWDFTKEIFKQATEMGYDRYSEKNITVTPVTTAEYGVSKAKRPFNSRLDKSKLVENGFTPLPTWQDAVSRYLKELDIESL